MHTLMSTTDLLWWVVIICIQAFLAVSNRHSLASLRAFLAAESIMGAILLAIARIAGPWTYFYSWAVGTIIHHGFCAFLMWSLFTVIRARGLPNRQNLWPPVLMGSASLLFGLYYASVSYTLICDSAYRLVMPMDLALSFGIGCMIAGLPFYALYVSAVVPRHINLVIAGLAIYEFSYAGLLGEAVKAHPKALSHVVDFVYIISLFLWSKSLRSKGPIVAAEYPILTT